MTEKICPFRVAAGVVAQGAAQGRAQMPERWGACPGSVCAWYDAAAERCAVLSLVRGGE